MNRIIGTYNGHSDGPMLLCIGAIHGNEPAGIEAIKKLIEMLNAEPDKNPDFHYAGNFIGVIGNIKALESNHRYIDKDLNRLLDPTTIKEVQNKKPDERNAEEKELLELTATIIELLDQYKPEKLVVLDLHTTSAKGGIFALPSEFADSIEIAKHLHAPVIRGFIGGIKGTSLHYFTTANIGIPTTAVVFEAGQHENPHSEDRCIAAIINCMRTIGCVKESDVESRHDEILQEFSRYLPPVSFLSAAYKISPEEEFSMQPGYVNFQLIEEGELLAYNKYGEIRAPMEGRILMPLYQNKGEDGFFIIKEEGERN